MISPLSRLLLWLGPLFQKGSSIEWIMLAFHLIAPLALLAFVWRGKMKVGFSADDLPVFAIPAIFHLSDIAFTIAGGFGEILWIVLLASAVHMALLAFIYLKSRRRLLPGSAHAHLAA